MSEHESSETQDPLEKDILTPQPMKGTSFTDYVRLTWREYVSIVFTSAVMGTVYFTPIYYYRHRVVPMLPVPWPSSTGVMEDLQAPVELTYPWEKEPLSSFACAIVDLFIPILVVVLFQFKSRDIWDLHAGAMGIMKAVVSTTFVCVILKQFIGGFRPYYMEACKPNMTMLYKDAYQNRYWFNATACTGAKHDVEKALQTFPSGHTATSFASAVFLTLYLSAKLKLFTNVTSEFWVLMIAIIPLIGAALVSGSMYTSHQHHAYDIVWGLMIGVILGALAYRSGYASLFDVRNNHIPLKPCVAQETSNTKFDTKCRQACVQKTEGDQFGV